MLSSYVAAGWADNECKYKLLASMELNQRFQSMFRHRPDTETGKGLSQIGVDKAFSAQVPLNSSGIPICLNFLLKVYDIVAASTVTVTLSNSFRVWSSKEEFKARAKFHHLSAQFVSTCSQRLMLAMMLFCILQIQ